MEPVEKLHTIATHMHLEPAEEVRSASTLPPAACGGPLQPEPGIFQAHVGGGRTIPMLKTMLTTACERNCAYCPFRAGRNYRRVSFKPEEMAQTMLRLHQAGRVQGLFLSSGIIKGGVTTQDKLLETVEILRRHAFNGYIHLKIMPGAERAQVERAMQLADRLSINLEAPTVNSLHTLAPMKQLLGELLPPLQWVEQSRRQQDARSGWKGRWPSTATQFVVGAAGETDLELLQATDYLYRRAGLRRAYYSAFSPVPNTPLENNPAESPLREHRLYQASFLLRDYGFELEDFILTPARQLPLESDPKMAWAQEHLAQTPVELNRAGREELLRVPGIGPQSAATIMAARRQGRLRDLQALRQLGIATKRLEAFVTLDGRRPTHQLRLF